MPGVIFDILTLKIRPEFIVKKCGPKITIFGIRMYALCIRACSTYKTFFCLKHNSNYEKKMVLYLAELQGFGWIELGDLAQHGFGVALCIVAGMAAVTCPYQLETL